MHILLTLLAPLLHLAAGTQLRINLDDDISREDAQRIADNLGMGSFVNVCDAKAGPKQEAHFVTRHHGTTCFGRMVAKAGDVALAFNVKGKPEERRAVADALRLGVHSDKLSVALIDAEDAKGGKADPGADDDTPPPAGGVEGSVPPPAK